MTVSVAPGTSGPVAWYSSSDGDSTAQLPATGGLSVGMRAAGREVVENCTVMVEPAATLAPVGETDETSAPEGAADGGSGLVAVHAVDGDEATGRDGHDDHATARISHRRVPLLGRACSPDMTQRDSTGKPRV